MSPSFALHSIFALFTHFHPELWHPITEIVVAEAKRGSALVAIDLNSSRDLSLDAEDIRGHRPAENDQRRPRLRMKSHQRLRSYQQILEDFQEQARSAKEAKAAPVTDEANVAGGVGENRTLEGNGSGAYNNQEEDLEDEELDQLDDFFTPVHSRVSSPVSSPRKQQPRREDTARRSKRLSLPAIGLQPTNVTARTAEISPLDQSTSLSRESSIGELTSSAGGRSRRFSLVLVGRNSYYPEEGSGSTVVLDESADLSKGVAAARLSELLGRKTKP
ncbi:hypothetical protein D9613_006610 [Agrocybe pediades]|uniref:Uncharacterized protein n=1 Tax=Agrocybe pediades TaxID=84607 RepID=A0A8H4QGP0_9AGAR|nr:hypothetical protein D9613_006610 [Agrocybe pediades]